MRTEMDSPTSSPEQPAPEAKERRLLSRLVWICRQALRLFLAIVLLYFMAISAVILLEELHLGCSAHVLYDKPLSLRVINATTRPTDIYYLFGGNGGWSFDEGQGLLSPTRTLAAGAELYIVQLEAAHKLELGVCARNATGWAWKTTTLTTSPEVCVRIEQTDFRPACPEALRGLGREAHQLFIGVPLCALLLMWITGQIRREAGVCTKLAMLFFGAQAAVSFVAYLRWPF